MTRDIRALTGLRGAGALGVVAYHLSYDAGAIAARGYLWVDMFFVLSGFVLGARYGVVGWRQAGRFLCRRLARIYPLYAVTTMAVWAAFAAGATWWQPSYAAPVRTLAASLLLVQPFGLATNINPAAWSIGTEWLACLLFPVLSAMALRRWPAAVALGVLSVAALGWLAAAPGGVSPWQRGPFDVSDTRSVLPVVRCVAELSVGLLCWRATSWVVGRAWWPGLLVAVAILIAMAVHAPDAVVVALFPALILSVLGPGDLLARVLAGRVPHRLGVLSYAIYLVHLPLSALTWTGIAAASIAAVLPLPFAIRRAAAMYAAILLVAWAAHAAIERPARRWLERRVPA